MRSIATFLPALCAAASLLAQHPGTTWDAATRARGWAFHDVDGSYLFLEPLRQEFVRWDPATGVLGTRPAPLLEDRRGTPIASVEEEDPYSAAARLLYGERKPDPQRQSQTRKILPERWILDPRDHCWAVVGTFLVESDPQGRTLSKRSLPAPVSDLVPVRDGFFLGYRTLNPYVQKFSWKGEPLWTHQKKGATAVDTPLHRIVGHGEDTVLLASLGDLSFTVLGPGSSGQLFFTRGGAVAEPLQSGKKGRGPLQYCPSRNAVMSVFPPGAGMAAGKGLVMACFSLEKGTLEWRSTDLEEGHQLIAVTPAGAVFTSPAGGLVTVPVP